MSTRDVVLSATFAALICAFGLVPALPLSFIPVPVTLQTLGVMLAGALLGPKRGAAAAALVVGLVAIGLPVLSGGRGGLGVLAGPTAGFLLGWVPGAAATGLVTARLLPPGPPGRSRTALAVLAGSMFGGIGVVYACGIAWLALVTGLPIGKAAWGVLLFLPGDALKAGLAAAAAAALGRVRPIPL